jgi:DNA-binding response OmpR family regulator
MAESLLVIEDEEGLALSLEDRFESEGYTVTVRHNGIQGEERARKEKYDCIILDIMLPG